MIPHSGKARLVRILPDFAAFGAGLGTAYGLKWTTTDLVWSLWLCSLVLGYLTLLSAIAAGAWLGLFVIRQEVLTWKQRGGLVLTGLAVGAFFLGFFSLHFCGFHAGHSVFLQHFFPVAGVPQDGFGEAFINPPRLWRLVFQHLMKPYGLFLIPAIVAERQYVFRALTQAVKAVRECAAPHGTGADGKGGGLGVSMGDVMGRPYLNVMRMHVLIFFFAFCHALKVEPFLVYTVVYTVYFFPWREVKAWRKDAAAAGN